MLLFSERKRHLRPRVLLPDHHSLVGGQCGGPSTRHRVLVQWERSDTAETAPLPHEELHARPMVWLFCRAWQPGPVIYKVKGKRYDARNRCHRHVHRPAWSLPRPSAGLLPGVHRMVFAYRAWVTWSGDEPHGHPGLRVMRTTSWWRCPCYSSCPDTGSSGSPTIFPPCTSCGAPARRTVPGGAPGLHRLRRLLRRCVACVVASGLLSVRPLIRALRHVSDRRVITAAGPWASSPASIMLSSTARPMAMSWASSTRRLCSPACC